MLGLVEGSQRDTVKQLGHAVAFALACFVIQNSSQFFSAWIREPISFGLKSPGAWTAKLDRLRPDTYFLSVGRPRGICDAYLDSELIASNRGPFANRRGALMVGAGFRVEAFSSKKEIRLECQGEGGFDFGFTHEPVVARYGSGLVLQFWRMLTEVYFGPTLAILFLGSVLLQIGTRESRRSSSSSAMIVFCFVVVIYSISLAHIPRFWLTGMPASVLHVVLRNLFLLTFLRLGASYLRRFPLLEGLLGLNIFVSALVAAFAPDAFDRVYGWQTLVFPAITFVFCIGLLRHPVENRTTRVFKTISVAFFLLQASDVLRNFTGVGAYTTPVTVGMIALAIAYLRTQERIQTDRIEFSTTQILQIVNSDLPLRECLSQIGRIAAANLSFSRLSVYLDEFCLGRSDQPMKSLLRVMDSGYKKDTSKDRTLVLNGERGEIIKKAIAQGEVIFGQGAHDRAHFVVVPIGRQACLSFSNDARQPLWQIYENDEVMKRLLPSLQTLEAKLLQQSYLQGFALERLRPLLGDGSHTVEMGATFADISDYSKMTERYGPAYNEFIDRIFLPALIKAAAETTVPESFKGDEVYLVSVPQFLPPGITIAQALLKTVAKIQDFLREEGSRLCIQAGYPPIQMSIGVNGGLASIVCDPVRVRTSGLMINEAKRLQEAAGKGRVLVGSEFASTDPELLKVLGPERTILIKKNLVLAREYREIQGAREANAA